MSRKPYKPLSLPEPALIKQDIEDDSIEWVSKSQMKRDMNALQALGVALIELSRDQLKKLEMPEKLLQAVLEAKKIPKGPAIKRQRQYIGRLMRDIDPAPIQAYLDKVAGKSEDHIAWMHQIERTREQMLASDEAVAELIEAHPELDIQQLRQMVRNARAERAAFKAPKAYRQLFQLLKELMPEPGGYDYLSDEDDEDEDEEGDDE